MPKMPRVNVPIPSIVGLIAIGMMTAICIVTRTPFNRMNRSRVAGGEGFQAFDESEGDDVVVADCLGVCMEAMHDNDGVLT